MKTLKSARASALNIVEFEGDQLEIDFSEIGFDLDRPEFSICPKCSSDIIRCNGLQKLNSRLAKTAVFGSDYLAKTPRCDSHYLQMDSHYLQTAHKNSSGLTLSAKTIFIMECQF